MLKYICLLAVLATAVVAYDFDDSDFNEYLLEDFLIDNEDSLDEELRVRRDAEVTPPRTCGGHRDSRKECCSGEKIETRKELSDSRKEVKKQCIKQVRGDNADDTYDPFDCQKMQKLKEQMICASECIAKKYNIVDETGDLNRTAIITHLSEKIGESKWKKDALEGIVDKCLTEVKANRAKLTAEETKGCNKCPLDLKHCIWREFTKGCPAELRVDTSKCNKIRERAVKGDTAFLQKHFLHNLYHTTRNEEHN